MTDRILDVYLKDQLIGQLVQSDRGALAFSYNQAYLSTAQTGISISLPLQSNPFTGDVVKAFFSGLLPEQSVRARLAKNIGLSEKNAFALLEAVGGDCAGALALYPHGEKPSNQTPPDVEVLSDARLKEILELIKRRPMLAGDDGIIKLKKDTCCCCKKTKK